MIFLIYRWGKDSAAELLKLILQIDDGTSISTLPHSTTWEHVYTKLACTQNLRSLLMLWKFTFCSLCPVSVAPCCTLLKLKDAAVSKVFMFFFVQLAKRTPTDRHGWFDFIFSLNSPVFLWPWTLSPNATLVDLKLFYIWELYKLRKTKSLENGQTS